MQSSLKFGTSGLRGLADELNGRPAYSYARAFVETLRDRDAYVSGMPVFVGRDLRDSSSDIAGLCMAAIEDTGFAAVDCGALPTPALSYYAMMQNAPSIMVTGSHIPEDRNGLKFYRSDGEIDKGDEVDVARRYAELPADSEVRRLRSEQDDGQAIRAYRARYLDFVSKDALAGLKVGVYQHSSVARDLIVELLQALGAEAHPLGRADRFVPVDTEALRGEDVALLSSWAQETRLDAIVSTDGDADRPLIADERGRFVRGDLVGAITADWVGADCIVTPVTANSALESSSRFSRVLRTKVGSPFVIAGMTNALRDGARCVVGFEANGGVLLGSAVQRREKMLAALPTRDAILPILACLDSVARHSRPLSDIAAGFGFRVAMSDRLTGIDSTRSAAFLTQLQNRTSKLAAAFSCVGESSHNDTTDGIRLFLTSGEVVHYRASGNAPELRCYVEANGEDRASELLSRGLAFASAQTEGDILV